MPNKSKGFLRRWAGRLWGWIDGSRRTLLNLVWLGLLIGLPVALLTSGPRALKDKTVLVLDLSGPLVEQRAGGARDALLKQVQGEDDGQVRLRDLITVLDAAARDPKIERALLLLEDLSGGGDHLAGAGLGRQGRTGPGCAGRHPLGRQVVAPI